MTNKSSFQKKIAGYSLLAGSLIAAHANGQVIIKDHTMRTQTLQIFIFILLFTGKLFAQPTIEWQNVIGGTLSEYVSSIHPTSGGGYIIAGKSRSNISGDKSEASLGSDDYWIININSTGSIVWQNTIGGSAGEDISDAKETSDGGYIVGGYTVSGISGDKTTANKGGLDYWILKLNSTGGIDWQTSVGGSDHDELMDIQQTSDGGYILGGQSKSGISGDKTEASQGSYDFWIVKLSATGTIAWQNTIGGSKDEQLSSVQQTPDGGYIVGGYSNSDISGDKTEAGNGDYDYWIVKLNSTGAIQWQNTIGGKDEETLGALDQTSDGGYILGGTSSSGISGDKTESNIGGTSHPGDYWVVKVNSSGVIEWQNTIGGDKEDYLRDIKQTAEGGYILGGDSYSGISGDKREASAELDYWLVKLNASGVIEWENTITANNFDDFACIDQAADGGYILCGSSPSGIAGDKTEDVIGGTLAPDYWVIKLTPCTGLQLYADTDSDGFGDAGNTFLATDCMLHNGYSIFGSDCNDANAAVHPGVMEVTNGIDDDCNGLTDDVLCGGVGIPSIEWQKNIGGTKEDQVVSAAQTADGGYIVGGYSSSDISGDKTENSMGSGDDYDYWIVKLDAASDIQWQNTIGGSGNDYLSDIQQTSDGGYIVGGTSYSGISGDKTEIVSGDGDYWVLKLSSTGTIEWQNTIGGKQGDVLRSLKQTPDGGYILGGNSASNAGIDKTEDKVGGNDYWIVKLTSTGSIQWQNNIGGSEDDLVQSIDQTADGGYIVGGNSDSPVSGDKTESGIGDGDYWIVKISSTGVIEWQNTIGSKELDVLASAQQTTDGGYIIGGYTYGGPATGDKTEPSVSHDFWVLKLTSVGAIEWQNVIGGSLSEVGGTIRQTTDGGYILGGRSSSGISGDKTVGAIGEDDYYILKLTSIGFIEWQSVIGGTNDENLQDVFPTADGGYFLAGSSTSAVSGCKTSGHKGSSALYDYWVIKLFPEAAAGCPLPAGLQVTDITDTKATLSWIGNALAHSYRIRKRPVGTTPWIYSSVTAPTTSKQISGNTPATDYEVQVQTYCNIEKTDSSDYTASVFFTSDSECPKPKSVAVTDITDTKATVSWTGNENAYSYRIRKRTVGTETWIYSSVLAPITSKTLSNNIPATQYEAQVQTYCNESENDSSGYTASVLFTTAGECTGATSQSTTNITSTSAKLNWTYTLAPNKWTIKYRAAGGDWITKKPGGTSTSYSISSLTPSTNYDWKIRAKCGSENSDWSALQHFTTSALKMEVTETINEFSVYPNPANGLVSLQFTVGKDQQVNIKVYDINGKEMVTWLNSQMAEGDHTLSFDVSSFAKGIYLVRMISESGIQNQKLIVQ